MGKGKKLSVIFMVFAVALLISACAGGKQENEEGKRELKVAGSYQESKAGIPPEADYLKDMVQLENHSLRLAGGTANGGLFIWESENGGETWEQVYDFTEVLSKTNIDAGEISIKLSPSGRSVLWGSKEGDSVIFLLDENFEIEEGSKEVLETVKGQDIQTLEWVEENTLFGLTVFQEGIFVELTSGKVESIEIKGAVQAYTARQDGIYLVTDQGIQKLDTKSRQISQLPEPAKRIEEYWKQLSFQERKDHAVCVTDDGDSICLFDDKNGMVFTPQGGEIILKRGKSSLGDAEVALEKAFFGEGGEIFALAQSAQGKEAYCFSQQEGQLAAQENKLPAGEDGKGTLTIYSLEEDVNIRQMVYLYQKKYPDMDITYEAGRENGNISRDEAIKLLNTRLASGEGPDVIVLEGLPYEKYAQQGMLEDLSGFAEEACKEKDLFQGVLSAYLSSQGQYGIPAYVSLMMLSGTQDAIEGAESLETLVAAWKEEVAGIPVFENWSFDQVISITYRMYLAGKGSAENFGQKELEQYYSLLCELYQMVEMEEVRKQKNPGSASLKPMGYQNMDLVLTGDTLNALDYLAVPDDIQKAELLRENNFAHLLLKNSGKALYVPMVSFGVVKGRNSGQAKDFLAYMVTEEVQESFDYAGLPVNRKAMEGKLKGFPEGAVIIQTEIGSEKVLVFQGIDGQRLDEWMDTFEDMEYAGSADQTVFELVLEQVDEVLTGSNSAGSAAEEACRKISLYRME